MRKPFDRWDIGEDAKGGAGTPVVSEVFSGTNFALRFDRRWEFIATWRWAIGGADEQRNEDICHYHLEQDYKRDMTPQTLSKERTRVAQYAARRAEWFLENSPGGDWNVLYQGSLMECSARSGQELPFGVLKEGLTEGVTALRDQTPISNELRALWLIEGCVRWGDTLPQNLEETIREVDYICAPEGGFTGDMLLHDLEARRMVKLIKPAISLVKERLASRMLVNEDSA